MLQHAFCHVTTGDWPSQSVQIMWEKGLRDGEDPGWQSCLPQVLFQVLSLQTSSEVSYLDNILLKIHPYLSFKERSKHFSLWWADESSLWGIYCSALILVLCLGIDCSGSIASVRELSEISTWNFSLIWLGTVGSYGNSAIVHPWRGCGNCVKSPSSISCF